MQLLSSSSIKDKLLYLCLYASFLLIGCPLETEGL